MHGRRRVARRLCRPSEALPPLLFMVVEPPENPTFSTKNKNTAGGISKNESKGGFSGGASACLLAQAAGLSFSHFARNRFELRRSFAPKRTVHRWMDFSF